MKEIYFKSFGYYTDDNQPAYACIGLAVHYNSANDLNIVKCISSVNLYRNLKNSEEATIAAGLDIFHHANNQMFFSKGDKVSFCITTGSLSNFYDQYEENMKRTGELLSSNQSHLCGLFNSQVNSIKNYNSLELSLELGITNRRTMFGVQLLSKVEDELIAKLQSKVDAKRNWNNTKRNLLDAEIKELDVQNQVIGEELEIMQETGEWWKRGSSFDNDHAESMMGVYHTKTAFIDADQFLESINNDLSYIPTSQMYF